MWDRPTNGTLADWTAYRTEALKTARTYRAEAEAHKKTNPTRAELMQGQAQIALQEVTEAEANLKLIKGNKARQSNGKPPILAV